MGVDEGDVAPDALMQLLHKFPGFHVCTRLDKVKGPAEQRLVRAGVHPVRLVPQRARHANRDQRPQAPRAGAHQLRAASAEAGIRPGARELEGPVSLRPSFLAPNRMSARSNERKISLARRLKVLPL